MKQTSGNNCWKRKSSPEVAEQIRQIFFPQILGQNIRELLP